MALVFISRGAVHCFLLALSSCFKMASDMAERINYVHSRVLKVCTGSRTPSVDSPLSFAWHVFM